MRPIVIRIIAAALLVMPLAGCYPMDALDYANATQGTSTATQPKQAQAPTSAGTPLAPTPPPGDEMVREAPPHSTESPTPPTPGYDPALQPLVEAAIQDLVKRLGVGADQIEVVEAQAVVWSDGSLGCPRPDMHYIQVPVDGARIVLRAADRTYEYHSGGSRPPFLCVPMPKTKDGGPKLDPIIPPPRSEDI